jgi:hypothetical protein
LPRRGAAAPKRSFMVVVTFWRIGPRSSYHERIEQK